MYRIFPLFPLFPLFPFFPLSTYLEPSFCFRIRPPLLPDARKLTLFVSPPTLPFSPTQNPDPRGFPDLNIHQLGRHCELLQMIRHRVNLLFFRVRWRREMEMMLLMMMMMIQLKPVCHKTEWQWHCVLRNCSSELSIYSKALSIRQVKIWGGGYRWSARHL